MSLLVGHKSAEIDEEQRNQHKSSKAQNKSKQTLYGAFGVGTLIGWGGIFDELFLALFVYFTKIFIATHIWYILWLVDHSLPKDKSSKKTHLALNLELC